MEEVIFLVALIFGFGCFVLSSELKKLQTRFKEELDEHQKFVEKTGKWMAERRTAVHAVKNNLPFQFEVTGDDGTVYSQTYLPSNFDIWESVIGDDSENNESENGLNI